MSTSFRVTMTLGVWAIVAAHVGSAEAGWGRYRVTTHHGTPSIPVVRETVVVRGAFRPVIIAPAPVVLAPTIFAPAPVTAYYAAPAIYVPAPRAAARRTYYAPAPRTYYFAPAPAAYYQGYSSGTYSSGAVILP